MNIKFSPPDITDLEINEVVEALKSGWITTGPKTKKFEREISKYLGVDRVVCLNSQTACSELCLRMLGIGPGDEVITSSYTYTASASVIYHIGATIKLIDIQKDYLEMDYDALENAITDKTKVIIPVDVAGIPCDYKRIFDIVERKKNLFKPVNDIQKTFGRIIILADAAHSFGASISGIKVGGIADFSSFSFHAVKNLTTAEGGALTWNNKDGVNSEEIYKTIQLLSLHGQNKDALSKMKLGAWEYDIVEPWYKCNMTDIMASIGLAQLKRYDGLLKRRKDIIHMYDDKLHTIDIETLNHYDEFHQSSGHLYITRIKDIDEERRNEIINKMAEHGIACNVHYKPLPLLTAYKNLGFNIDNYQNSYNYYKNEITLPLHTCLSDEEIDYVINNYISIVNN